MSKTAKIFRLTALLLCLALLTGCASCGSSASVPAAAISTAAPSASAETSAPAGTPAAETTGGSPSESPEDPAPWAAELSAENGSEEYISWSDGVHADTHFDDMSWEIYDMTAFNAAAEALSSSPDEAEAERIYSWLVGEYNRLRTYSELVWIDFYSSDDPDGRLADACQQIDDMLTEAGDTLRSAASDAVKGPSGEAFSAFVGEETAENLAEYEAMTDREVELQTKETELELEYNEISDDSSLSPPSMNLKLGSIFLELIRVRNELAELYGYDSYAQYAYESVYGRDYTPEDAAALCKALKPYARRYYADCYYSDAFQEDLGRFSAGELMDLLREYAPRISSEAGRAQAYMEEHGLYLLESMNLVTPVGFTTLLPRYNAPFLYNSLYGSVYDVGDTFHEFGHYYDAFINPEPDPLGSGGSYDIFEIHSTGMEALLYGWYDEIFGRKADVARIFCLDGLIDNVVSGCIYDEFQQYCYAHPDMTVDQVNRAYYDIASSYGRQFFRGSDRYAWMNVSHNFESPFYYISYAVSTLASLQLWAMAEHDRDAAIRTYNDLLSRGAYELSYFELIDAVGLRRFTTDLAGCFREAYDTLHSLCRRYDRGELAA